MIENRGNYKDWNLEIICITNRHLSVQDYMEQIQQIAKAGPRAVIVREKDLPQAAYEQLAAQVLAVCTQYHVPCILHTYTKAAIRLGAKALHLSLPALLSLPNELKQQFTILGASVHSVEEALQAQNAGAAYLLAGHVFATDCKRGVPPRGLSFYRKYARHLPCQSMHWAESIQRMRRHASRQERKECVLCQSVCAVRICARDFARICRMLMVCRLPQDKQPLSYSRFRCF